MLTRDETVALLNISPEILKDLVNSGMILETNSRTGDPQYPAAQFSTNGLNGRFASFLGIFRNLQISGDTIWTWLNQPSEHLESKKPLDILTSAVDDEAMDTLRFVAAAQWSFQVMEDPSMQRTDWLKTGYKDEDTVGDYTPKRRGGQYAS